MCMFIVYAYFPISFTNDYFAFEGAAFNERYFFSFVCLNYYFVICVVNSVTSFPPPILPYLSLNIVPVTTPTLFQS